MNALIMLGTIAVVIVAAQQSISEAQKCAWSWATGRGLMTMAPYSAVADTPDFRKSCAALSLRQGFLAAGWAALAVLAAASAGFILGRGGL